LLAAASSELGRREPAVVRVAAVLCHEALHGARPWLELDFYEESRGGTVAVAIFLRDGEKVRSCTE